MSSLMPLQSPPALSVKGLAGMVRDRLVFARLAGAGVWLAWLLSLALGGWRVDATGHPLGADHVQFYVVGQVVAEGHSELVYDVDEMARRQAQVGGPGWRGVLPFRYPPCYALCFVPTSYLPYEVSWAVWTALGLLCLFAAAPALGVREPLRWLGWAVCFYPVFAAVSYGQNSLLSLALLSWTYALWARRRPFAAGLVAGLLLYKPQLLVGVGFILLLERRRGGWRALAGLFLTGAVLAAASAALAPGASLRFVGGLGEVAGMYDRLALAQMYSTQGWWLLLLPGQDATAHLLSLACSGAALAALLRFWLLARASLPVLFAGAVLFTLLLTPYAMLYDWSILLVPATLLWRHLPAQRARWQVLFAAVWLVALVSAPLVRAQLLVAPAAVQLSVPALALTAAAVWRGVARERPALSGGAGGATLVGGPMPV